MGKDNDDILPGDVWKSVASSCCFYIPVGQILTKFKIEDPNFCFISCDWCKWRSL